jgi:hypothetical protein
MNHTEVIILTIIGIAFLILLSVLVVGFVVALFMWWNKDKH